MSTDLEVDRSPEVDVVPYTRGASIRKILKGALTRFLPGSVITTVGGVLLLGVSVSGQVLTAIGGLIGAAGALTAGFGLGLLGMRRWLYPDAQLDGTRSFIAGLMSPLALFVVATGGQGWSMTRLPWLLVLVGVVLALGMFFAWLTPTPEHMRPERFRSGVPDQLREPDEE